MSPATIKRVTNSCGGGGGGEGEGEGHAWLDRLR